MAALRRGRFPLKSARDIEDMRIAGQIVGQTLHVLGESARPGMTTAELDKIAYDTIIGAGAKPNFLGYGGFSGSVCISVNEEIVHGIPGDRVLQPGDIVSFDGGAMIRANGKTWHGDAAITVVLEGGDPEVVKVRKELSRVTEQAMWAGIARAATAKRTGDIGQAIERSVLEQEEGLDWTPEILEGYTGHGIGTQLHEDPEIYNYATRSQGPKIVPGTVICIEPMLVVEDATSAVLDDGWTVVAVSGADAAHWEHTVAIGANGISVLTASDFGKEGLAPFGITPVSEFAN